MGDKTAEHVPQRRVPAGAEPRDRTDTDRAGEESSEPQQSENGCSPAGTTGKEGTGLMEMDLETQIYVAQLEQENRRLKALLDQADISYQIAEEPDLNQDEDHQAQGERILSRTITVSDARQFFKYFWGRTDVYAQRVVSKRTGLPGYYPQCANIWTWQCPKKQNPKAKCSDCKHRVYKAIGAPEIMAHLRGNSENASDVIGIYPLLPDDTCRLLVFDFDFHGKKAEQTDYANPDDAWKEEVNTLRRICLLNQIDALVERSRSGKGAHVWIFFQEPIDAALARKFGTALLHKGAESVNLKTFRYYDRMLPLQDHLPPGSIGNLIALPLQGQALKEGNSAFIDENWNAYPDQWQVLFATPKYTKEFIQEKLKEWEMYDPFLSLESESVEADGEKPWEKTRVFCPQDVDGVLHITWADGVYVETSNLKPRIQNRIRELAAFSNPEFYQNQAMGLSNFQEKRYIYLGSDLGGYIHIPSGLSETLVSKCEEAEIPYEIEEKRCPGRPIRVKFRGELRPNQQEAAETLLQQENGILNAATAFGKTAVLCHLIARRKTNTLVLLPRSALIPQWQEALEKFLEIEEEPPEYTTPGGQIRKRKSVIGLLQGAHDSTTGIVDIAMIRSVCKKGECHPRLKEYGMILMDECHHGASDTAVEVLQQVRAQYVYGATATAVREDHLQRIAFMLLGPIRYKYTAKERAREQGIDHLVYPRFTRSIEPVLLQKENRKDLNQEYEIVRHDSDRDDFILSDVKDCIAAGRTPIILSRFVDHTQRLHDRLLGEADHVFLLLGKNSKKEHQRILEEMKQVPPEESMILLATGSLIGEGFDYPRLDTLIMATPVSGQSVVEQYSGRLNRDYEGKRDVVIYDYVDSHIPRFGKMYQKRLKAYRRIGYRLALETGGEKQSANAIFDMDNYLRIYQKDLLEADREIILSSPVISRGKVHALLKLLEKRMDQGLQVIVVTLQPDRYKSGDPAHFLRLQEEMRQAGIQLNLVENYCEHFCVIDRNVVWYGSMNFLGKEDAEDNLMRVCSPNIAAELLELTFGNEKVQPVDPAQELIIPD